MIKTFLKLFTSESRYMKAKWRNYKNDMLNLNTMLALVLFFLAVILRFIPAYGTYIAARYENILHKDILNLFFLT